VPPSTIISVAEYGCKQEIVLPVAVLRDQDAEISTDLAAGCVPGPA
jgi:hypothetical protein